MKGYVRIDVNGDGWLWVRIETTETQKEFELFVRHLRRFVGARWQKDRREWRIPWTLSYLRKLINLGFDLQDPGNHLPWHIRRKLESISAPD